MERSTDVEPSGGSEDPTGDSSEKIRRAEICRLNSPKILEVCRPVTRPMIFEVASPVSLLKFAVFPAPILKKPKL